MAPGAERVGTTANSTTNLGISMAINLVKTNALSVFIALALLASVGASLSMTSDAEARRFFGGGKASETFNSGGVSSHKLGPSMQAAETPTPSEPPSSSNSVRTYPSVTGNPADLEAVREALQKRLDHRAARRAKNKDQNTEAGEAVDSSPRRKNSTKRNWIAAAGFSPLVFAVGGAGVVEALAQTGVLPEEYGPYSQLQKVLHDWAAQSPVGNSKLN